MNPLDLPEYNGTIGVPIPSTDACLKDDNGNMLPIGEVGELCIKGPQVMKGYWQRPEETANVIDADGWLHTGDMAKMDERGYFTIVDRKKDMILVSGFNVYPNEVEDVIALMPGVLEVAAIGVPDDKSGEAVKVVHRAQGPGPHRRAGQGPCPREPDRLQAAPVRRVPHGPAQDQRRQDPPQGTARPAAGRLTRPRRAVSASRAALAVPSGKAGEPPVTACALPPIGA